MCAWAANLNLTAWHRADREHELFWLDQADNLALI